MAKLRQFALALGRVELTEQQQLALEKGAVLAYRDCSIFKREYHRGPLYLPPL